MNVLPKLAGDHESYRSSRNPKLSGQRSLGNVLVGIAPTDGGNHLFGELGHAMFRSDVARIMPVLRSSFESHVGHVVFVGAEEQMIRADAVADIAVMENHDPIRNGAEVEAVGKTVNQPFGRSAKGSIAISELGPLPQPTGVSLLDFRPEALFRSPRVPSVKSGHAQSIPHYIPTTAGAGLA